LLFSFLFRSTLFGTRTSNVWAADSFEFIDSDAEDAPILNDDGKKKEKEKRGKGEERRGGGGIERRERRGERERRERERSGVAT
jgi:hypothetical protein